MLAFGAIASAAEGRRYFVDATSGNDSNSGLTSAVPWKTLAKVNGATFAAGNKVLFKRGETWREQLTVPSSGSAGNPIVFGAYGTGDNPVISGSVLITSGWTKDSANIWQASVTTQPNVVYFNGTRGTQVAATSSITSEFKWFWVSNVLYVWSPNDGDPSAYYNAPGIEAGSISFGVIHTNDKSYVTIDGITVKDGNTNSIRVGFNSVTGVIVKNCIIERSFNNGFDLRGDTTAHSVTVDNCTIQNNGGWGIWVNQTYTNITISNNLITGNGWTSLATNQQYAGIQGYLGNANIFNNIIHDNVLGTASANDQSHGIYALSSTVVANIYDNVIYNHPNGGGIRLIGSANVFRNTLYGNSGSGIVVGQNGSTNVVYVISYNLVYNNNSLNAAGGIVEQSKGTGTISLTLDNNTIYQNGNTSQQEVKISDNLTVLRIRNNLLFATSTRRSLWAIAQTGTVSINYNLHWRADGNPSIFYDGAGRTWAQWQGLGFDIDGVNANPQFTDAANGDFTPQSNSPCIDAGTDVGLTTDFAGNPIVGNPDIGAFEYQP